MRFSRPCCYCHCYCLNACSNQWRHYKLVCHLDHKSLGLMLAQPSRLQLQMWIGRTRDTHRSNLSQIMTTRVNSITFPTTHKYLTHPSPSSVAKHKQYEYNLYEYTPRLRTINKTTPRIPSGIKRAKTSKETKDNT